MTLCRLTLVAAIALCSTSTGHSQQSSTLPTESSSEVDSRQAFPVVLVQTTEEASRASEREALAAKHDAEDLEAQREAATAATQSAAATAQQVIPAYWQAILATVGAIGLLLTIWQSRGSLASARRANINSEAALKLARDANEHAELTSQRELRAYISVNPAGVRWIADRTAWVGHVEIQNVGKVPARGVKTDIKMYVEKITMESILPQDEGIYPIGVIQPGVSVFQGSPTFSYTMEDHILIYGRVDYDDGFGVLRWTTFCHRYSGASREVERREHDYFGGIAPIFGRQHKWGNDAT